MSRTVLQALESRLLRHFGDLRRQRNLISNDLPIFALEHNLTANEFDDLSLSLRSHIAITSPSQDHMLCWIVYAAEFGYQYSGSEYWHSFERQTPGWNSTGDRHWIRRSFEHFQKIYGAASPSGVWAGHFSIISWPITHAILPKDLQQEFARVLYELRYWYSKDLLESPKLLGELIAANRVRSSSRFQSFAADTFLVGQVSTALLLQSELDTSLRLYPPTLNRIRKDLESHRRAREWLRDASRSASERIRVRGLAIHTPPRTGSANRLQRARATAAALGIEPRLTLRPNVHDETAWDIRIEIPDLTNLQRRFPSAASILSGSRCRVAGATRPLARGRCLHGPQRVPLSRWPRASEVLLKFDQSDEQLDFLLSTECLLRPRQVWLFRIASDGVAYESRGHLVRPDQRYIVARTDRPFIESENIRPVSIECRGINAALIDLPESIDPSIEQSIAALGLQQAKTITIWPAGLAAAAWDGEGHGEWLSHERPCLGISADHPIDTISLSISGSRNTLTVSMNQPGEPIFVQLPVLKEGLYNLNLIATTIDGRAEDLGNLNVNIRIREPSIWVPGLNTKQAFNVYVDPFEPTLEELWDGRVDLSLHGPEHHEASCTMVLLSSTHEPSIYSASIPSLPLPLDASTWRHYFDQLIRSDPEAVYAYERSKVCQLRFEAGDLGEATLNLEREPTPLRWSLNRQRQHGSVADVLSLHDDTGELSDLTITRAPFDNPAQEEQVCLASTNETPAYDGLYTATRGIYKSTVVIPHKSQKAALGTRANKISRFIRSPVSVTRVATLASHWSQAQLYGDLITAWQRRTIVQDLIQELFRLICGDKWESSEVSFYTSKTYSSFIRLSESISNEPSESYIGWTLKNTARDFWSSTLDVRIQRLANLTKGINPAASNSTQPTLTPRGYATSRASRLLDDPEWIAEFALRLASDPGSASRWSDSNFRSALHLLSDLPTLASAARFVVVVTDCIAYESEPIDWRSFYGTWRWI